MSRSENFHAERTAQHPAVQRVLPSEVGTAPLPEGHVRMFHQTPVDNVESIRQHGLLYDKARGIEGPKGTWVSDEPFYGNSDHLATVEIAVPDEQRKRIGRIGTMGDVPPRQIVAIHEPWHRHLRYALESPRVLAGIHAGEYDDMLESDSPMKDDPASTAVAYIKKHGIGK